MTDIIFIGECARFAPNIFANKFGPSIFTTMAGVELWPRHYARLHQHCARLGYDLPKENILLDSIERCMVSHPSMRKIRVLVAQKHHALSFEELAPPPTIIYEGVRVCFSTVKVDEHWRFFKSTDRRPYELALQQAQAQNCFEAMLLDEHGHVVDGTRTSLLIYDDLQNTFTWALGGIDGVMRAEVASYLQKNGFAIHKAHIRQDDIVGQLLLCNSLLGVVPVGVVTHPVVRDLVKLFCPISPLSPTLSRMGKGRE